MGYISKGLLLKAYTTLSNLTEDHKQGQTQIVSFIRHFVALDMFYKRHQENCNLALREHKNEFIDNVKKIVGVDGDFYAVNFYNEIKKMQDCGVGSNFFSAGIVSVSKHNTQYLYEYPTRGQNPLLNVKNNVLIRNVEFYHNVSSYLKNDDFKSAFLIWFFRNVSIESLDLSAIKNSLSTIVTDEMINAIIPNELGYNSFVNGYVLSENNAKLDVNELLALFNITTEENNPIIVSTTTEQVTSSSIPLLTALRTKPFVLLAGISGTGKSRIVRELAKASVTEELQRKYDPTSVANGFDRWKLHKPANFELIQVKPNWHNSLEVVGYKSNIGGAHYEFTPFVEFVARAWQNQNVPFFLCLDEMNLAPVEQYFAEFLSAIESRSFENDEYETDPIIKPFKEFGGDVCNEMLNHLVGAVNAANVVPNSPEAKLVERFRTKGLTLPKNLLVLGTVNMDETTFSFSRKVLDRAMSIVMNEVDYDKFFLGESESTFAEMDDNMRSYLVNRPIRGLDVIEQNDSDGVKNYLSDVNVVLNNTPFKLGYRAANEALLYVSAAQQLNQEVDINAVLDEFTLMKILSRIEGDKRSIGNKLGELLTVVTESYPKSHAKLADMAQTLQTQQFVSYWA